MSELKFELFGKKIYSSTDPNTATVADAVSDKLHFMKDTLSDRIAPLVPGSTPHEQPFTVMGVDVGRMLKDLVGDNNKSYGNSGKPANDEFDDLMNTLKKALHIPVTVAAATPPLNTPAAPATPGQITIP